MVTVTCLETLAGPSKVLIKVGLLNTDKLTISDIIKIMLNYLLDGIVCSIAILNMRNAIHMKDNTNAYWMACLLIPMATYSAKKTTLLVNRSSLITLLQYLKSTTFNSSSESLNRHIQVIHKISQMISRYFAGVIVIMLLVCGFLPFIMDVKLMIPAPFNTGEFDVGYKVLHVIAIGYLGVTLVGLDMLYMTLIGLGVAQINILEERLVNTSENFKQILTKSDVSLTKQILRECAILYDAIYWYVENLSILLSLPLSIQYVSGCFAVCNMLLQLRNSNEAQASVMGTVASYCGITLGQMTAYHWLSNEIIYKSNKITTSCYFSKWYELSTSSQNSIMLIMERAKRPLTIRLYNYILLNLDSLGVIFRWSYSVFALMKAKY